MGDFLYFLCDFSELFLEVFVDLVHPAIRVLLESRDEPLAKLSSPFGHFGRPFST